MKPSCQSAIDNWQLAAKAEARVATSGGGGDGGCLNMQWGNAYWMPLGGTDNVTFINWQYTCRKYAYTHTSPTTPLDFPGLTTPPVENASLNKLSVLRNLCGWFDVNAAWTDSPCTHTHHTHTRLLTYKSARSNGVGVRVSVCLFTCCPP